MSMLSINVSDDFKSKLKKLSKATSRKKTDLLLSWCENGLELEEWQIERVEAGIKAADNNAFVSNNEVTKALKLCRN